MKVGLVGIGTMGFLAAKLLIEAGEDVVVSDVSDAALTRAREMGMETAVSPQAIAAQADIIMLILPGPPQIEAVVTGANGLLAAPRAGQIIVDMSTSAPATTEKMAAAAKAYQVEFLDAPILGRPSAVGNWVLPTGGEASVIERARPVLEKLGTIVPVGGLGAGHTLKLLNALMFSAINVMTAEMMAIAEKSPIDPAVLYQTIGGSQAATVSGLFREVGRKIVERDFSPTFPIDLLCKDNGLAVEMARELGAYAVVGTAVQRMNEKAQAAGFGAEDTSALVKYYENLYENEAL